MPCVFEASRRQPLHQGGVQAGYLGELDRVGDVAAHVAAQQGQVVEGYSGFGGEFLLRLFGGEGVNNLLRVADAVRGEGGELLLDIFQQGAVTGHQGGGYEVVVQGLQAVSFEVDSVAVAHGSFSSGPGRAGCVSAFFSSISGLAQIFRLRKRLNAPFAALIKPARRSCVNYQHFPT